VVETRSEQAGSVLGSESDVRRSYLVFPAWSQPLWTWLTGKPLQHESPPWRVHPAAGLALTVLSLMLLATVQYLLLTADALGGRVLGWLLVLPASLVMAGLWRCIQVVFGHHAIHGTLLAPSEDANRLMARLLTLFSLSQSEAEYERDHLDHHRRAVFTTLRDADANLLYRCGLRPGEHESVLRRRLLMTLFSPRFHGWFLLVRLGSNLRRPLPWRVLALLWVALVFVGAPLAFGWVPALLILWLPLVLVYQMSALLQFSTEHVWLQSDKGPPCMFSYADRCHGRFCGELVPGHNGERAGLLAWARWWLRTLFLHLPTRLCVLVGDLPAHDWHHLCSILRQDPGTWPLAIYERQRAIDSGHDAGMQGRELWGLDVMVAHVLRGLALAAALPDGPAPQPKPDPARWRASPQER
jgi:hypothetical protein